MAGVVVAPEIHVSAQQRLLLAKNKQTKNLAEAADESSFTQLTKDRRGDTTSTPVHPVQDQSRLSLREGTAHLREPPHARRSRWVK